MELSDLKESTEENIGKFDNLELNHEELINLTREAIDKIIESDPLLSTLPCDATVDEIRAQTAVAQGQAITLYLDRGKLPKLSIVVPPNDTTVLELKKAIQRQTNLTLQREKIYRKISWKHVWKKYNLCCDNIVLSDQKENIISYGIYNKAELNYVKRRREKNRVTKPIR